MKKDIAQETVKAFEIAKKYSRNVNFCEEYSHVWIFYRKNSRSFSDAPVVVYKETYEVVNMTTYIDRGVGGELIREIDF